MQGRRTEASGAQEPVFAVGQLADGEVGGVDVPGVAERVHHWLDGLYLAGRGTVAAAAAAAALGIDCTGCQAAQKSCLDSSRPECRTCADTQDGICTVA